jgi:folate-binding protein YgfZ
MAETVAIELDGQYRALREEAGFLDRPRGMLTVGGADAAEYLQGQLTNDIEALEPDEGCYAALLDRKGHLQADMRVLRLDNGASSASRPGAPSATGEIWLDLEPETTGRVLKHLRTYSIGRDVEIDDVGSEWAITSLIGPAAGRVAGFERLGPEHRQAFRNWEGVEVLGVATDLGIDLITRAEGAAALRELLVAAGAVEVSEDAAEILRVESGRPRFGRELSEATMPAEAGLEERAISFTKGCYIGQEPVARLHYRGKPNRHLRGLRLRAPAEPGQALSLGEKEVGRIGTAAISPALGPIALAVVRREAEPGETVEVADGGTAEVVELPFDA